MNRFSRKRRCQFALCGEIRKADHDLYGTQALGVVLLPIRWVLWESRRMLTWQYLFSRNVKNCIMVTKSRGPFSSGVEKKTAAGERGELFPADPEMRMTRIAVEFAHQEGKYYVATWPSMHKTWSKF